MAGRKNMNLAEGPVTKQLILFAVPIILTNLLQHLYTVADRIVVGNFAENGKAALAAVGSTSHAINLMLALFTGIGVGVNVICANLRGAQDEKGLRKCMHTALIMAAVLGTALAAVGFCFSEDILKLMNTNSDVLDQATLYMQIYFLGVPASLMYNFGAGILRSQGDTRRPMYILGSTGLVNVVLNLVLVIGLGRGVDGVAIATITAQYLSAITVLIFLFSPKGEYDLNLRELRPHGRSIAMMLRMGVPCGINAMLFNIGNVLVVYKLNGFQDAAVIAGGTVATDINHLQSLVLSGFSTACVSFSGQCMGAGKYKRIDKMMRSAILWPGAFMICFSLLCTLFTESFLSIFNSDPDVIAAGVFKLRLNSWGMVGYVVAEVAVGTLRGMKESTMPTMLNVFSVCGIRLIWILLIFPLNPTPDFLYLCYPISWACCSLSQGGYYLICRNRLRRKTLNIAN